MNFKGKRYVSSESVTEGHPDKVCDQISDAVLDEIMKKDPAGRVACETFITRGMVVVGGEITTKTYVDVDTLARQVIKDIGYTHSKVRLQLRDLRRHQRDRPPVPPTSPRAWTPAAPATRA